MKNGANKKTKGFHELGCLEDYGFIDVALGGIVSWKLRPRRHFTKHDMHSKLEGMVN